MNKVLLIIIIIKKNHYLLLLLLPFECYIYKLLLPPSRDKFIPANSSCFPGSLQVFQQISHDLFPNFFINFIIFKMSKKIIKQEVDLVLLSELFSIRKYKEEESNWYILTSSITGQKSTSQIAQYVVEGCCGFCIIDIENICKAFWWFSESIQTLSKMTFL